MTPFSDPKPLAPYPEAGHPTGLRHDYRDLIRIFNGLFQKKYHTILQRGGDEPRYLPKSPGHPHHRIIFAHGYFASALHEIAHWCIAGRARRQRDDYGYWYEPDGRSEKQQKEFERVEVKPQALEWLFSVCCGSLFRFSTDNLQGQSGDLTAFKHNVRCQVMHYLRVGPPGRARRFMAALSRFYNTDCGPHSRNFLLEPETLRPVR